MTMHDTYLLRRFLAIYDTLESVSCPPEWNATVPEFLSLEDIPEPATGDEGGF